MKDKLKSIREEALNNIQDINNLEELDKIRIKYMGKKGELTLILREMGKLSKEERPIIGQMANEIRQELEKGLNDASERIKEEFKKEKMEKEKVDISINHNIKKLGQALKLSYVLSE